MSSNLIFLITKSRYIDQSQTHLDMDRDGEPSVAAGGGDPCLCRSSCANAWRSLFPPPSPTAAEEDDDDPPYWLRGSTNLRCCVAHDVGGSTIEAKSYGETDAGKSVMERGGGGVKKSGCGCVRGGGRVCGWGSSRDAKWACK